jgi:hypothetical protein
MWVCNVFPKSTMKHYPFKTVANSLKVVSVCSCPGWWAARQPDGLPAHTVILEYFNIKE